MYLPWGPRSFHRKIHQSYDAPRMAGDSAHIKRNNLHDGKHSSKCTPSAHGTHPSSSLLCHFTKSILTQLEGRCTIIVSTQSIGVYSVVEGALRFFPAPAGCS